MEQLQRLAEVIAETYIRVCAGKRVATFLPWMALAGVSKPLYCQPDLLITL
ncbi:TPA: hypothetical protein ACF0WN_003200 [Klebsiella pneumoniae]